MDAKKAIIIIVAAVAVALAYILTRNQAVGAAGMTTAFSGATPNPTPGGVRTVPYTYGSAPTAGPLSLLSGLFKSAGNVGFSNQAPAPPPPGTQPPSSMPVGGSSDVLSSVGSAVAGNTVASPIDLGTGIDTPVEPWDSGIVDYSTGYNVEDASQLVGA